MRTPLSRLCVSLFPSTDSCTPYLPGPIGETGAGGRESKLLSVTEAIAEWNRKARAKKETQT
jgi:hypothetical protein